MTLGGFEFLTSVMLFVLGLFSFKEMFLMMLQNGISRKTMFIGRLITMSAVSIVASIIDRLIINVGKIISKANDKIVIAGIYDMMFEQRNQKSLLYNLKAIFITIFLYMAVILFGYFIAAIFYRMNRAAKLAVAVGVPAFLLVVLPILDYTVFNGKVFLLINNFLNFVFAGDNPYNLLITCLLFIAAVVCLSWVVIRKAVDKK